ncbi:MAG: dTDP-4-dehydrorhamnose reductase [Bacteroidaceae bacterium]|nr:dTDP-4-dehydrorhamnose reductase [Bacteroidaceae bacterium]
MNILITGSNGQLGTELRLLAQQHPEHRYVFTDIQELDITHEAAVQALVEQEQVDCIINCAAYTAVDKAESDPALCTLLNATAPALLAAAMEQRGGIMLHISTDYVFDGTAHVPYTEDAPTHPQSTYGRTKLMGEEAVRQACRRSIILRTAWLYSPWGNNFVKTMMRLGRERDALGVVFDQVGTPTYAADLAQAILTILGQDIVPGTYHFTNEGVTSWYDFALAIHRLSGITTCHVRPLHTADYPTPAQRPHYSVLDKTKVKDTYHLAIPHWEESLRQCIRRLQEQ